MELFDWCCWLGNMYWITTCLQGYAEQIWFMLSLVVRWFVARGGGGLSVWEDSLEISLRERTTLKGISDGKGRDSLSALRLSLCMVIKLNK